MTAQLNTLLRLRQYEVDRCQSQLAVAALHEQSIAGRVQELDRQQEQQRAELSLLTRLGQLNIDALRLRQRHVQHLTAQRLQAQTEFEAAAQSTQQHRAALIAADQRRQIIEKLRERLLREAQGQQRRSEAADLEQAWHFGQ